MSKTRTVYLCPITKTPCDNCEGDSDCGLTKKPKEIPVRINPLLSYEVDTEKAKCIHKIRQTLLTFSKTVLYATLAYCILTILGMILCLL